MSVNSYSTCVRCGRGQNPASPITWYTVGDELFCERCYVPPELPDITEPDLAVIPCPLCRLHDNLCFACTGLRVVRIARNAIPVWSPVREKDSS